MLNRKILIILLLGLHLAFGLKSANFCKIKQKECQGSYDEKQKYEIKCDLIKCFDTFKYDCGLNVCSSNMTECNEHKKLVLNEKKLTRLDHSANSIIRFKYIKELLKFKIFKKEIQFCEKKIYKFNSNDFCQTGLNCIEKIIKPTKVGYNYDIKKIDCKCPNENSLKYVKYCAKNSNACDYLQQKEIKINKTLLSKVKKCGNDNVSILRSNFRFFESF